MLGSTRTGELAPTTALLWTHVGYCHAHTSPWSRSTSSQRVIDWLIDWCVAWHWAAQCLCFETTKWNEQAILHMNLVTPPMLNYTFLYYYIWTTATYNPPLHAREGGDSWAQLQILQLRCGWSKIKKRGTFLFFFYQLWPARLSEATTVETNVFKFERTKFSHL